MLGNMWLPISSEKLLEFIHRENLEENIMISEEVILRPPTIGMRALINAKSIVFKIQKLKPTKKWG